MGVATSDGKVKVYDVRMMNLQQLYSAHEGPMSQAAFHPNGTSATMDGIIRLYDLLEAHPIFTLHNHEKEVQAVEFSLKGEFFCRSWCDRRV